MKSWLLKAGIAASLIIGILPVSEVAAQTETSSSCTRFGEIPQNQNPSFQHINCLLTTAAIEADIPPEVVKAVASQESGWRQFDENGKPYESSDGGIGIMQLTNKPQYDQTKLRTDIAYNIKAGVEVLNSMYAMEKLPKIKGSGREVIENWYFAVMAYNGLVPVNSPLVKKTGVTNTGAYQEQVFSKIERDSFSGDTVLTDYPFTNEDFLYDDSPEATDTTFKFTKLIYELNGPFHYTAYNLKPGDRVMVTFDGVTLRTNASRSSASKGVLPKGTGLIIDKQFVYDTTSDTIQNHFVWFPVKTEDGKTGYISSAYIEKTNPLAPSINTTNKITNKDTKVVGKTESKATVVLSISGKHYKTLTASEEGNFSITIPVQNTGTEISAVATDRRGNKSPARTIKVNRVAPNMPTMNTVTNKTTLISGKTEANAKVTLYISGKSYKTVTADKYGAFKIPFTAQNAGTVLTLTAKDAAGKVSAPKSTKALKVAPNRPSVSTVDNKDFAVSGKTEANATVTVAIAGKKYVKKADKYGNFKIGIPVQNWGTKISVTAKDSADRVSAAKSATVIRVAPNQPVVNKVRYYSTSVTGKTEKYATVTVKVGTRTYTAKANVYGTFSVKIPKYRVGTKMYFNAKDSKGKISVTRTVTVS
ncbi:Ig-like domain-containing protein [Bacillus sp. FJAT-18017]|uniref:Ig-like domain-containing protein n=1 Tax=Bacillus sp. FJAT-18017 TaxID=1705566 RepID=UPI0009E75108|nr:Ig-like domain-containing protein [Bacillus sp. FJAT-18017]